ncbi:gliding motility lipoprotein GldH [Echinicola marina]|uniref:gliding motility lipoprotein GldH n=1 Tax=Echinicola marina TaxID=2859768 RepID=UPI001CF702A9|nr:gliding motility lipoprotein GldH [Echinicola marina]UCS93612.1 gliding motility lipoprotein GldH [Echinicola marina]
MNKKPSFLHFIILGLLTSGAFSCDSKRIYEEYHGLSEYSWAVADTLTFEVPPITASASPMSTLRIKYNDSYDYYNIYVKYILKDSLDSLIDNQLLDIYLFDPKTGKPLGDGFGNTYTQLDTIPFKNKGQQMPLKVQLIQYMRSKELKGIESIGLKIEKE